MFEDFTPMRIPTTGAEINLVKGGEGPPLLLLHGYPETHVMWHKIAPRLAKDFTLVCPDLRGYGDSTKPTSDERHSAYSKRAMAQDQIEVMATLGFEQFCVAGHDRGGRVTHRMALDHSERVLKAAVLDIVPTYKLFETTSQSFATAYYHWFFLIQPDGLPEHMIGLDPDFYLKEKLKRWSRIADAFDATVLAEFLRCFRDPATIHASCEDYRAAATIDLEHDEADLERKITCPLLALWGKPGLMGTHYDVLETWRERASNVTGQGLDCGHFLAEEAPDATFEALEAFFGG